uniref:ATP synthase subunit a n=2 Tax=Hylaeus dilatatus TaxID=1542591 RepID=A0A0U1YYS1_9HYME|nr:ATP synthase F0 subunit 6 [Hylaeus dilatatus]AJG02942.1 ATP synthase F0 subunit 6 [Hylaeus dilatatus]
MKMMTNLFSIFDPTTSFYNSMNWMSLMMPLMFMPFTYWLLPSRLQIIWMMFMNLIFKEFNLLTKKYYKSNIIIFISLMSYIMLMNLMGLISYIFTPTSHLSINLTLSLTLWLSFMFYGWLMNTNNMFIHLVPLNTPLMLMNFMVLIESISNFIRPWTLSIRLTANMIAGHLLMSLLGSSMNNTLLYLIPLIIMIQNMLMILEISVSMIQSYVFSVLSLLYFNESN